MELMPEPMALPGCCFKCRAGSNNRDFFVDTEFSMDDFGAVYICNECIAEMAHAAGYILPEEARKLKFQANFLKEENEELEQKIFGLEQAIDGLRIAGRSFRLDPELDADSPSGEVNEEPSEVTGELGEGEGESPEPLHDEGMAELSDDDSSAQSFSLDL